MSRPVTPLPALSPIRSETPSQRRKPVPAYLDTTFCGGLTESEPSSAIVSASRTAPPRRFANVRLAPDIYANPLASHSLGALKLYDGSPTSPEDTAFFKYSPSTLGSISSFMSFSASSAASTDEHCRSSLESVEQGCHPNQISDVPSDDLGRLGHLPDRRSQHFVLSVDAPLSQRRTSAAESLGRRSVSASVSTPVLTSRSKDQSTTRLERSSDTSVTGNTTPRFKLCWEKIRRNV